MEKFDLQAQEDFNKAHKRARLQIMLSKLQMERSDLLSLYDIKKLLKPKQRTYLGIKAIPVNKIVGSEGRYLDFNKAFLPKRWVLKERWKNIDKAHMQMISLPSINVYKVGDSYFVRDGNHRVSVARMHGIAYIDAEVIELSSEITPEPGMTDKQLRALVVDYERQRCLEEKLIDQIIDMEKIEFTEPGRYTEMLHHINVHKYYINMDKEKELPFSEAARSWFNTVYLPIYDEIIRQNLLNRFPGRKPGDLYMWIVKHWDDLKEKQNDHISIEEASIDYANRFGTSVLRQWKNRLKKAFNMKKAKR
ncbi:MAG: hypothetical protein PWQ29_160 [Verrucomicrobiota bacterium]|jgi:hypothetical protein|nr:hypothetical protein [Verrucomicrobiota bacterium]